MTRTSSLALALFSIVVLSSGAGAQPRDGKKPAPNPYVEQPASPGPTPDDPYAEPKPGLKPDRTSDPKPVPRPAPKGAPKAIPAEDPYADPPAEAPPPPEPVKPTKPARPAKPGKQAAPPVPVVDTAPVAPGDPYAEPKKAQPPVAAIPQRVGISDLVAVQGLLAVQRLDGWLLFDRNGENPIAARLVAPAGNPRRPWFYLLPAKGEPVVLVHTAEQRSFEHLPGKRLTYVGHKDLEKQLRLLLKGQRSVAVEYSAKAAVPSVSRVDAGTIELIRGVGVQVRSSETLVQFTKAIWGDAGRTAHYVAAHHLVELRKDALAFIAKAVQSGQAITEYDVQQRLVRGMTMRGLASEPPVVAAGANTADAYYVPTAARTSPIQKGDVIVISLAAKVDKPEGVWAAQTWVAVADARVPEQVAKAFETASLARDQALALITDRMRKRRPVTGADVDDAARGFIKKAGLIDKVMHRTGHSIDNDLQGAGADLDNYEVRDTRILTPGTGFTVGPGLYFAGQFGVRTEVSVYLAPSGPEVTTAAQDDVEAILVAK